MSLLFRAHGANPEKLYAAAGLPVPENMIIDFSTNTNALPWDGDLGGLETDLRRCLAAYPDDASTELRILLAGRAGCAPENVLVVNGSNEGIYLAASLLSGKRAAVLQPAYGEYLRALSAYGAATRDVFTPEDLREDTDAFFICNPCNPTGTYIESAALESLFVRHPRTLFVIDEAYTDFLTYLANSASPEGSQADRRVDFLSHENVVILRSLTKIFHLCGVRIGYVLAGKHLISRLKARQPSWSVNAVAQAAALAFLQDGDFIRRTRAFYASETPRFMRRVEESGFPVRPTRTHFFLIEADPASVQFAPPRDERLIRALMERAMVVRHTRNFPGLNGRYIRVSTRLPEENDKLVHALREFRLNQTSRVSEPG